jgi:fatty-acyl-CoA synthase
MGLLSDRLAVVARAGRDARWRVETVARVGHKLGMHRGMTWEGARVLARELSHGRATPSTLFRVLTANQPDRAALIQAGVPGDKASRASEIRRISYAEADATHDRIAAALLQRGIGRGSAALVVLKNRIEFYLVSPAINRAGAAAVTVSWRSTVPEIEYLARHSGAEAAFFDADVADLIREAAPKLHGIPRRNLIAVGGEVPGFTSLDELVASTRGAGVDDASDDAPVVIYTSGTTGKPKGAVRKFAGSALPGVLSFVEQTPLALDEVHLTVCPLYHSTAAGFSAMTFMLRGTVVVLADYRAESFLEAIERYGVTSTAMVPTMIQRLVDLGPEAVRARDTSSLRAIFSGGAPLGGALAVEAMDAIGDKIYNFYGATETGIVTFATPADLRAAPGTIGRAVPGNDIRLLDEHGRDVPEGGVGELYVRNGTLVEGYHADPDATRRSMLDGYFSVGDLARRDREGRYHIEGRKRDMIISGGVNVYPAEVEATIEAHPAVAEIAVIGVPDREWGERVVACVALRAGAGPEIDGDALKAYCRARLSGPKVPRDFVFLDHLPHNPTGKIMKRELRSMVGG